MKALCLQLSVALCAILSTSTLIAQPLNITCPDSGFRPVTCLEDVPPQSGDSLGFLTYEGALIEGVTGKLNIEYTNFIGEESGCSDDAQRVIRIFRFTDESDAEEIMCNVRYSVRQETGIDALICNDISISLDESGNYSLQESDLSIAPQLQCSGDISISNISFTEFSCEDINDMPVANDLSATTECGEELNCNFNVFVIDTENPVITCPDNILVTTEECVCETPVEFMDATASDNCTATISRTDETGLNSRDFFPAGLTLITFEASDTYGNTSTCNLQVRVNSSDPGSIICESNQNISLSQNCDAVVTPSMVVDEPNCDIDSYKITLFDQQGNQLPSDTITGEYLGTIVTARATYECFDNYCELSLNVEDKIPPMMNCRDTAISCSELIEFPLPEISDNCSTFEVILLNQKLKDVSCDSVDIDKIITRTYGIKDDNGTIIETCDQNLLIMKFDIEEVEGPELMVMVDCGSGFEMDENGNPDPSVTGAPSLNGIDLFPQSDILCNVSLAYEDMVLNGGTGCGRNLLRTWTVFNWYCGEDGMATFKQSIAVVDTTNPVIIGLEDVTISSASNNCETMYTIPEPDISDNCQSDLQLDIFYPGGVEFDTNSIDVLLPLGENLIQYRLNDRCGNMVMESYTVTVEDNIEPVAICASGMSFSLDGNGMAVLTAQRFDNGSLDACSDALLEIARMSTPCGMEEDTIFGPSVILCCEDIDQDVMVALRVTDESGNANSCMTSIQVVDQSKPTFLTNLPDITVSNDFPFDTADLSVFGFVEQNVDFPMEIIIDADSVAFSGQNVNAIVMDNCSVNEVLESRNVNINMCQVGTIIRTFVVADASGVADTITQTITLIAQRDFTRADITFPNDTIIMNECPADLDPQSLGLFPIYDEGFNSTVAYTNEDDTLNFASEGCFTLQRIWFVSDWCNRPDGLTFATYIDTQQIQVIDLIVPEITSECMDTTICSFVAACGPHPVNISATGTDNCTTEDSLDWTFMIEYADERPDSLGIGNNFNGLLPVGVNTVTWFLDDGCGNTDECSFDFTIESCLTPQPVFIPGKEFYISSQDTSDNQIEDPVNIVRVSAEELNAKSSHPCGKEVFVAFSDDPNDSIRIFDCEDLGSQSLMLYAIDEDGKSDFVNISVVIQDTTSEMLCGMAQVSGTVFGNEVDFVKDVNVTLEGTNLSVMTNEDGSFTFPEMTTGGNYSLSPSKNDRAKNGVSTTDIVMIQRHILGIQTFDSPYKRLAADVDQSSNISAADIITMRKLLLGIIDEFSHGETWKFVPGNHVFTDPENPWGSAIPKKYDIYHLNGRQEMNFIGIKLGDVNQNAQLRNEITLTYTIEGNKIHLSAEDDISFAGLFLEISLGKSGVELEHIETYNRNLIENHHLMEDGKLRILLSDAIDHDFEKGKGVLTLELNKVITNFDVDLLEFNNENSEVAFANGNSASLKLESRNSRVGIVIGQNVPNPWVEQTSFDISMPDLEVAQLRVMDISGKIVHDRKVTLERGRNVITINHSDLPSSGGMYIYEISTSYGIASKKMMLIRN